MHTPLFKKIFLHKKITIGMWLGVLGMVVLFVCGAVRFAQAQSFVGGLGTAVPSSTVSTGFGSSVSADATGNGNGSTVCSEQDLSSCTLDGLNTLLAAAKTDSTKASASTDCTTNSNSDACKALMDPIQQRITNITNAMTTLQNQQASNTASNNTKSGSVVGIPISVGVPVVGIILKAILYLVLVIIGFFITLSGFLMQAALSFNDSILNFQPPFIITGWTIFRDIANLGFVLGIIVIAMATILRNKSYQMQSLLWKLIVAALLVNFSLLIGGIFIKITNSVSAWLLSFVAGPSIIGTPGSVDASAVARIGDSFGFTKLISQYSIGNNFSIWSIFGPGASFGDLIAMVVLIIFGLIIFLTLIGMAGMLFMRYFYLSFLLIVAPMVWLMWVFPSTKQYWKQWWDTFIHWCLYAPTLLLFLYISIAVMNQFATYSNQVASTMDPATQEFGTGLGFGNLMTSLIAIAMLIGGLKMAQKMGHGGAKMALNFADKTGKWAKTKAQTGAKWGRDRATSGALKSKSGQRVQNTITSWGSKGPLGRMAFGGLARGMARTEKTTEKGSQVYVDEFKNQNKDLSPDQIKKLLPTLGKEQKIAAYEMLAGKNKLDGVDISNADMQESLEHMNKLGRKKEAGDFEKKMGRNLNMVRLLQGQVALNKEGEEDPNITFDSESAKFFQGFSENDWKNASENVGKTLFSTNKKGEYDKKIPGDNEKGTQTEQMRKSYITAIKNDLGKAIHSTVSKLQDQGERAVVGMFVELGKQAQEEMTDFLHSSEAVDHPDVVDKESVAREALKNAIKKKDPDAIAEALQKSSIPSIVHLGKKIDKSMASVLGGSYGTDGDGDGKKTDDSKKTT